MIEASQFNPAEAYTPTHVIAPNSPITILSQRMQWVPVKTTQSTEVRRVPDKKVENLPGFTLTRSTVVYHPLHDRYWRIHPGTPIGTQASLARPLPAKRVLA